MSEHQDRPDALVATLARLIIAIERRRRLTIIEGGKPMPRKATTRKAR